MDGFDRLPLSGGAGRFASRGIRAFMASIVVAVLVACGNGDDPPVSVTEASATIGVDGGTVEGPDGVIVKVPAGALTAPTTIRIARAAEGSPSALPDGYTVNGNIYEITPHDLVFLRPVTVEMPWTPVAGAADQRLFTASPSDVWLPIEAAIADGKASWPTNAFSWFMIGICAPQANDPYTCVWPRVTPTVASSVPDALTLRDSGIESIAWTVSKPTTLDITLAYAAAADCVDARLMASRRASATRPAEMLIDTAVALGLDPNNDKRRGGSIVWTLPMSEADNGLGAYDVRFSCRRLGRDFRSSAGGMLAYFADIAPQPPQAPSFVTNPASAMVTVGETAAFSVAANGNPAPTLKWQVSTDSGATWADIAGATSASYTTPATVIGDDGKQIRAMATNASGSVPSAAATLTVRQPSSTTWEPAALMAGSPSSAFDSSVGFDASGQAVAVWSAYPASVPRAYASVGTVTGGWSTPVVIDGGGFANTFETRVAVGAGGNATAVWGSPDSGGRFRIAAARFAGGAWEAPQRLDVGTVTSQDHRIAVDDNGRAVVAWVQGGEVVYSMHDGAVWSAPVSLGAGYDPAVGLTAQGLGYIAWLNGNQPWTASLDFASGVGSPQPRDAATGAAPAALRFAMDRSGHGVLAWVDFGNDALRAARVSPTGTWSAAEAVATGVAIDSTYGPSVGMGGSGQAIAAWSRAGNPQVVYSARYPGSGNWIVEQRSATGASYALGSRAAMNASGVAAVVWAQSEPGGDEEVWAQVYDGGWLPAQRLQEPSAFVNRNAASTAVAGSGAAVALWVSRDAGGTERLSSAFRP